MKTDVWVITEGMAGTENPCVAVAEALGMPSSTIRLSLIQPWKTLSPYLSHEQGFTFRPALSPPWPKILITSGRKSLAAARYIKRKSGGQTLTVHIQDPRIRAPFLDLIAVPAHDQRRGENVIVTDGAPCRITKSTLEKACAEFPHLQTLPGPRIAVLIGGKSHTHDLPPETMRQIATGLSGLNGGLMITTSRRTGNENIQILKETLKGKPAEIFTGDGKNPYLGFLAWADMILVTSDSVSMISDACTTGTPVYAIPLPGGSAKFNRLYKHLESKGVLRLLPGVRFGNLAHFNYTPLNDAEMVASAIKKLLEKT